MSNIYNNLGLTQLAQAIAKRCWVIDYRIFNPDVDGKTKIDHVKDMLSNLVDHVLQFIFPLPPLAEQKRIVEKCDRLEALKQGRESTEKLMEVAAKQVLLN